jgi:hypothetical protein
MITDDNGYPPIKPGAVIMQYKKAWQVHEDFVDKNFTFNPYAPDVNAGDETGYSPLEIHSMLFWLRYAATIGDMSYLTISGKTVSPLPNLKRPPFRTPVTGNK